jgi:hypothetical protein
MEGRWVRPRVRGNRFDAVPVRTDDPSAFRKKASFAAQLLAPKLDVVEHECSWDVRLARVENDSTVPR